MCVWDGDGEGGGGHYSPEELLASPHPSRSDHSSPTGEQGDKIEPLHLLSQHLLVAGLVFCLSGALHSNPSTIIDMSR